LGTDTLKKSCCKVVEDPWSGKPVCLIPSANPDVAIFHVHRCDCYGNTQIDGIMVEDFELSRAARRVIITTEEIIDNEDIRKEPYRTAIPFFVVDAVCEVQYGAHPTEMPYLYFFDEAHIGEWLDLSRTSEGCKSYFDTYVYSKKDFSDYLESVGGQETMAYLADVEHFRKPMRAPWLKNK
jgi:hypothetical protein